MYSDAPTTIDRANLLPSPEDVAKQLLAKMSREGKELLEKISAYLNPENGETQMIPEGKSKYRFPDASLVLKFNALTKDEQSKIVDFVKLSGWTHLYIDTVDVDMRDLQSVLVIEKRPTWGQRFANILK